MEKRRAPFYLRRTKEAMVYFPERQSDGTWASKPVFTKRIIHTADFDIDGAEFDLYQNVTRFVKRQSAPRRRAGRRPARPGRRIPHVTVPEASRLQHPRHAPAPWRTGHGDWMRASEDAQRLASAAPPDIDWEEIEELEDADRERLEKMLEAITLAGNADEVRREIVELQELAEEAKSVEGAGRRG